MKMSKTKKVNKNPNTNIKKIETENSKKKKLKLQKIKLGPLDTFAEVLAGALPVDKNADKKSKPKKALKGATNGVEKAKANEVKVDVTHAASADIKKDVAENIPACVKQAKREKNKLKKKLKIASEKEKTSESVAGPGQTIFVGNLPINTKRVQLLKLFASCGSIMTIRFRTANGRVIFKHIMRTESAALNAYVLFDNIEAATKALELNGITFKGHILRVQKAENTQNSSDSKNTIFVGNLKYSATDDSLHQIFSSCGEIEYVRTLQSSDKKGCNGTAYVCFKSPDAVGLAMELKGTMLDERPIHVERYSVNKLGSKNKRIAENKTLGQGKPKGVKQSKRIQGKKKQNNGSQAEKKKKSEFRGVKAEKVNKKWKKKIPSQMKRLANKIAPKD